MNNRILRSVLSVVLVLCMLVSTPIAALASGQTPAEVAVADAVDFCAKAQQIVDIIVDLAIDGEHASDFENETLREAFKGTAIDEIKKVLDDNEDLMQEFGFAPTDANKQLVAEEVFKVACMYADAKSDRVAANKMAVIELIRFALVEAYGYSNADAEETAAFYHEVDRIYKAEGELAALEYAESVVGTTIDPEPHEHTYTSVVTAPTCTEKGYTTYTCICGDTYKGDEVAAMGHSWDEGKVTKEPTATEKGVRTFTCITCKSTKTEEIDVLPHEHSYTSVVTDPTCTEKGYTTHTCSVCGDTKKDSEVAALGHISVIDKGTAATCTNTGLTDGAHCSRCNQVLTKQETIPMLDHTWDAGKVTKEPTDEEAGSKLFTCTVCGNTKTEEIPKLNHEHSYSSVITQPTCTEKGYITYTCTSCGDSYQEVRSEALGHDYQDGTCVVCGEPDPDKPAEPEVVLEAPEILSCYSKLQTSVKVTWSLVAGADGYELWRTPTPDNADSWTRAKTVADGSKDRYTNQGLEKGTTYYYKVRAYVEDASGNRTYSDFSNVDYMPAAVVWDDPYSNATFRIRLRWDEIGGAHGYQIWRLNADGETWSVIKTLGDKNNTLTNNQGATTAYSNTGLTAGNHYTYKIRAFCIPEEGKKVFGAYSDEFTVAVMPEAPVVTATTPQTGRVQLAWDTINGAAGYQVWMLENGSWKIVKSLSDGSTTYTKYDLQGGVEYQFKVRAYTDVNGKKTFGAYSEIVAATPAAQPQVPNGKCGDNLTWKLENGTLTISGSGAMYDFKDKQTPWIDLDVKKVVIASGVTTIGDFAFKSHDIADFTLPNSLKEIGDFAFLASSVAQIKIPDSVTYIGDSAFKMTKLTSITLPKGLKEIVISTFSFCEDLKEVVIQEGVTTIGKNAFTSCKKLENITFPSTLKTIEEGAFSSCRFGVIALPDSVTSLGIGVFQRCSSLQSVYLPAGLTVIPESAFQSCSNLLEIFWPAGLTTIEKNAFSGCNSLAYVYFLGEEEQLDHIMVHNGNDVLAYVDIYLVTMITEQPADQTVKAGEKVTFHAEASREGCTYQWYCLAPDSDEWVACTQSGNKTDTLSFTATKDLDGYYFLCEITDPYGNSGDTEAALLTVK